MAREVNSSFWKEKGRKEVGGLRRRGGNQLPLLCGQDDEGRANTTSAPGKGTLLEVQIQAGAFVENDSPT